MHMSSALLVFCIVAVAYGTHELVRNRRGTGLVVGGTNAGKGKYPEFAIIYYSGTVWCGGTVLNKRSILTAASCINGTMENYEVVVGKYRANRDDGTEQYFNVSRFIMHESFGVYENDIGIIRIDGRINYDSFVQPTNLARGKRDENFTSCFTIGMGISDESNGGGFSRVLQELSTNFVSRQRCKMLVVEELDIPKSTITKQMLCTYDSDAGACYGDGGGPVGCFEADGTFVQVGILSFGSLICADGFNVYTRVSQYKAWIKENS